MPAARRRSSRAAACAPWWLPQASLPWLMKRYGRVRHLTQVSVALGLGAAWIAALTVPDLRGAAMLWMALSPVWAGVTVGVPSAWRWVGVHGACAPRRGA